MEVFKGRDSVFSRRLRELRGLSEMSQGEAAKSIGVTKSSMSLYECGVNLPDAEKIAAIARLYNVSADYLLGLSDFRTQSKAYCEDYANGLLRTIKDIYAQIQPIVED